MKKLFPLLALFLMLTACLKQPLVSIREPKVYQAELDFNDMAHEGATKLLRGWLASQCKCEEEEGELFWETEECEKTAKHILVIETRIPYHRAMQEYNGGLRETRPPENPPEVPDPSALCPGGE